MSGRPWVAALAAASIGLLAVALHPTAGGTATAGAGARERLASGRAVRTEQARLHPSTGDPAVPILMYHIIGEPPAGAPFPGLYVRPADFRAQVAWLGRHGYSAVTLSDVWEHWHRRRPLPARPIVFTFDDGYRSTATVGLPTLRRRGWPAVLNLKVENLRGGISPAQVRALLRAGWELGAHTITHPDLTGVDAAQLKAEVRGSRSMLERRFGVRVWFFCYPSGRYDGRVVRAVRLAGFRGATTTEPGLGRRSEPFTLDRIRVSRGDSAAAVGARLRAER